MQLWSSFVQQSIYGISGGRITSLEHEEYIVHTYSGSILTFTSGNQTLAGAPRASLPATGTHASGKDRKARLAAEVNALDAEVRAITAQVEVCLS
jgi:hypothetical protein